MTGLGGRRHLIGMLLAVIGTLFCVAAERTAPWMLAPASLITRPSIRATAQTNPKSICAGTVVSEWEGVVKNARGEGGSCAAMRCGPGGTCWKV